MTSTTPPTAASAASAAGGATAARTQILDRGYRHYDGPRTGTSGAMRSVVKYTAQRALGIHRKFRYKIVPILVIAISFVPHIVWVGIIVLTNRLDEQSDGVMPAGVGRMVANELVKDYPGSYGSIVLAIALFAAFVAPEVLCTDRSSGMLGLYLASPLNRTRYLAAKAMAIGMLLSIITVGPALVMLTGYTSQGYGPDGFGDCIVTLARVLGVGVAIAAFHTLIAAAISSITTRRAAASATFIVLVLGAGVLATLSLVELRAPMWVGAFDLVQLPSEFAYRVFGRPGPLSYWPRPPLDTWVVYAGFFGWMAVSLLVIWDRYRRAEVTK